MAQWELVYGQSALIEDDNETADEIMAVGDRGYDVDWAATASRGWTRRARAKQTP